MAALAEPVAHAAHPPGPHWRRQCRGTARAAGGGPGPSLSLSLSPAAVARAAGASLSAPRRLTRSESQQVVCSNLKQASSSRWRRLTGPQALQQRRAGARKERLLRQLTRKLAGAAGPAMAAALRPGSARDQC